MGTLSTDTEVILKDAGWQAGRRIAPAYWISVLESEGFAAHSAAVSFLSEFGDLQLKPAMLHGKQICPDAVFLDPVRAASGERDRVVAWEARYQIELFPVGEVQGGAMLCCSPAGQFVLGILTHLQYLGAGAADALNQLACGNRQFPNFPYPG